MRHLSYPISLCLLSGILVLNTSAGMIRHDVDVERYREIGRRREFVSVGRYSPSPDSRDYAAGVLISKRWILTAAHFPNDISVWSFGSSFYRTKRIIRHPKLEPGATEAQWNGWDLALVELDRPVMDVQPAVRYRGHEEVGAVVTKIGYGYVGDGLSGLKTPAVQERLGGENVIDAAGGTVESRQFGADALVFDFDSPVDGKNNRFGSAEPLSHEIGGSKGDSGGGVFMQQGGQWQLVGIVSGALNRHIRYGSMAALARVSSANAWIDSVIGTDVE
jgi:hypothetical protein